MIFVYIGIPFLIVIGILMYISHKKDLSYQHQIHEILKQYGTLHLHQYHISDGTYHLHLVKVNLNEELVINSPITWEVHQGSNSRLIDLKHLSRDDHHLFVIYPSDAPIKRYINENEMVFVKYNDTFNKLTVVRMNELELFLKERCN